MRLHMPLYYVLVWLHKGSDGHRYSIILYNIVCLGPGLILLTPSFGATFATFAEGLAREFGIMASTKHGIFTLPV